MGDLAKSRKSLQGALEKSWKKCEKWTFTKKNEKNSESSPGCILRFLMVLDLLGRSKPIKAQHFMIFRHFEIILIDISMILRQILFNKLENLIFFENFLRNCLKFVYLWKISILSMDMFLVPLFFSDQILSFFFKFWSLLAQMYSDMLIFSEFSQFRIENQHTLARIDQNLKKISEFGQNFFLGVLEIYPCSKC